MKRTEKLISAFLLMTLGVMFMLLKDDFIGILMTVVGGALLVLGVVDIFQQSIPLAIVKLVSGLLVIVCGWAVVEAVLYILSGLLLTIGLLMLYDKLKRRVRCATVWLTALEYATAGICIGIGVLLLFHQTALMNVIFIVCGLLALIEGGILLFFAITEE